MTEVLEKNSVLQDGILKVLEIEKDIKFGTCDKRKEYCGGSCT